MLSPLDISIICRLQEDMPVVSEPYKKMADELGISEQQLLNRVREFLQIGIMRRFGAILNHRNAGFKANAMVVWKVPEENIKKVTDIMVGFKEVSHCCRRPVYDNWFYNIFTMIHGQTKNICEDIVQKISELSHIDNYSILYSICEFKKTSMKYFKD